MIDSIFSPALYYRAALSASGVEVPAIDIEKTAAADGRPVEVAKLARQFFEQTQIDGIEFDSVASRKENAYKLAEAFHAQAKAGEAAVTKIADGLARFLKHAAEGYLAQNQIELSAEEALKIAALQLTQAEDAKPGESKSAGLGAAYLLDQIAQAELLTTAAAPAPVAAAAQA